MTTTKGELEKQPSSEQEEEILIKNIDTGEAQASKLLIKDHQSLILSEQAKGKKWNNYLSSIKKMDDKLLEIIIHRNHVDLVNILTEYPIELSKIRYMDGWTLLHFAVGQNDYIAAQTLLKFGLDVDISTAGMQRTALHQASFGNKAQLVRLFIDWGAQPNLLDADRNTAIHFAVDYGYEEVVKIILTSSKTVDLNIRNCMNMTTFNTCRNPDIFEMLIDYESRMQKNTMSSKNTESTLSYSHRNNYQSRLIIRNSDVFPCTTRVDMVERFLSLRETPAMEKKVSNDMESIISQESIDESIQSYEEDLTKGRKGKKRIGGYLRNKSILKSQRIASQNVGLVKESIFMTYLEGKDSVDNFDILRKLGQGSFAEVFLVRRKRSSNLYALKKIDKKILIENNLQRYIQAQKSILTKIKHPFIIEAYSCLQDFTHLYILLQFCQYGDLQKFVRQQGLSQEIARTYVCEAALALEEIHNNGFLYRDLKASNILLDSQGHIRLADFGLAKQATTTNSFLGSVSYVAPQMLVEGEQKPHSKALDWYLLGIFLYELLHELPPFYSQSHQYMQECIRTERLPVFDASLSKQVKEAILKLLQKDPSKRVQSLEELKKLEWFSTVDWTAILERKGRVMELPKLDMKELRRKAFFQSDEDKVIDEKIQWFQNWNYPKD